MGPGFESQRDHKAPQATEEFFYAYSKPKLKAPMAFFKSHSKTKAYAQQACLIAQKRGSYTSAARAFEESLLLNLHFKHLQLWMFQQTS